MTIAVKTATAFSSALWRAAIALCLMWGGAAATRAQTSTPIVQALLSPQSAQDCPQPQPATNMSLSFDADFIKAGALNPRQWRPFTGQHGDLSAELQAFAPGQVKVDRKSGLSLTIDKRRVWGHPFVSGEVTTQGLFAQTYGRFEILAKMPQANGLWPAFWLMPTDNSWPPEIDVVEYVFAPFGKTPNWLLNRASIPFSGLHWIDANGAKRAIGTGDQSAIAPLRTYSDWGSTPPPDGYGRDFTGYHSYAVDWRPRSLVWLIDGRPVFCVIDEPGGERRVPNKPMYMILSAAVAPGTPEQPRWPGYVAPDQRFPLSVTIAHARAWTFADVAPASPRLQIMNLRLARASVPAGAAIGVEFDLRVGDEDLRAATGSSIALRAFDLSEYDGVGGVAARAHVRVPALKAHAHYTIRTSLTVPATMKAGAYALGANVNFTCQANQCAGGTDGIWLKQAAILTVRPRPDREN